MTGYVKSCKDVVFPTVGCAFPARNGTQHRLSKPDEDTPLHETRRGGRNELLKEESRESHGTIVLRGVKYVSVALEVDGGGRVEIRWCYKF